MARVQVLSTPGCAGCARTKHLIADVLAEYPELDWEEIDLTEQPELAARYDLGTTRRGDHHVPNPPAHPR